MFSDSRWDITYLGMQVLIEGLALAAFASIRDMAKNPLAAAVNAYVMQDEARHVAFGRLALRDYYPQLTQKERDEREEFAVEACYLMRDRFLAEEVWETLGLPVEECVAYVDSSASCATFARACSRASCRRSRTSACGDRRSAAPTPTWAFSATRDVDGEALMRDDERVAAQFDARGQRSRATA